MLKLFRNLHILYLVVGLTGVVALGSLPLLVPRMFLLGFPLALLWAFLCGWFFNGRAKKRMQKINDFRMEQCDLKSYTEAMEKIFFERHSKKLDSFIRASLSTGYHDLGMPEKALELLHEAPVFLPNASGATTRVIYYNNMASSYLQLYDSENASRCLKQMHEGLSDPMLPPQLRSVYAQLLQDKEQIGRMVRGDYHGAEDYFRLYLERNPQRLPQTVGHYYLAKIYMHRDDVEKAKECLRFAAENGGDTFYAKQAKDILAGLAAKQEEETNAGDQ